MRRRTTEVVTSLFSVLALLSTLTLRAAADTPVALAPPSNLAMLLSTTGFPLPSGSWTAAQRITFRFDVQSSSDRLTPEVELEPSTLPFKDQPNEIGSALTSSGQATVPAEDLSDGKTYHWQARVIDTSGLMSPWVQFAAGSEKPFDLGVDRDPPSRPLIQSPTDPDQSRWYHNQSVVIHWSSRDGLSGIKGFAYVMGKQSQVVPRGSIVAQQELRLSSLADGVWVLVVRALDRAGNWSPPATFRLQLDRQVPRVDWLSPNRFTFNPFRGPMAVRFRVSKDVAAQLALYRVGAYQAVHVFSFAHLRAGQVTTLSWSGKDERGQFAPRGYYFFAATAVDHANNVARLNLGGIQLEPEQPSRTPSGQLLYTGDGKRIIVSLSRQTLYAYDGVRLLLQTYVTTGNPSLPTPPGRYTVLAKYHPFEFVSPWPPGSPYWYPPSWSTYAMPFRNDGYYLHDAPWRSAFGPGTNGPGQPGTNFGGTHGCINIPPGPMLFLWNWTPVGTPVLVVP